eukprot:Platyproteum_vivax@DN1761_c0_g1_i1.p1
MGDFETTTNPTPPLPTFKQLRDPEKNSPINDDEDIPHKWAKYSPQCQWILFWLGFATYITWIIGSILWIYTPNYYFKKKRAGFFNLMALWFGTSIILIIFCALAIVSLHKSNSK